MVLAEYGPHQPSLAEKILLIEDGRVLLVQTLNLILVAPASFRCRRAEEEHPNRDASGQGERPVQSVENIPSLSDPG